MNCLIRLTRPCILLALCLTTGCAASGQKFTPIAAPADKAVVYIYRIKSIVGAAVSWEVFANGPHITRVDNGGYFAHVVDPGIVEYKQLNYIRYVAGSGLHNLLVRREKPLHTLEACAGSEYFLRWKILWGGDPILIPESKEKGLRALQGLRAFANTQKTKPEADPH